MYSRIDHNGVIKVADFGLTEDMYGANYFRQQERGEGEDEEKVPIKWMAPESLEEGIFTEATDVVSLNSVLSFRFSYTVLCMKGLATDVTSLNANSQQRISHVDEGTVKRV